MPQIVDYAVVYGAENDAEAAVKKLRARVKEGISAGWQPIGGVSAQAVALADSPGAVVLCQAMVRYDE